MVTISGESAGAMSVAIHMTSNESEGLFHQVTLPIIHESIIIG